jgi:hypothetical protein
VQLACAAVLILAVAPCSSAEISLLAGVNRDTITVGDPVTFRVRVWRGTDDHVEVLSEGPFPGPFEIRDVRPPTVRESDRGGVEETRDYVITLYRTGEFEVPPLMLRFRAANGDTGSIRSSPIPVVVKSVKPEDLSDIRDIKPPVEIAVRVPLWAWVVAACTLIVAAAAIWYGRWRRRRPREEPPPPPVDWHAELEKIARMGLVDRGEYKQYYTLLSELFRRYLEARAGIDAMERTTFEIMWDLRDHPVGRRCATDVEGLLSEADMVKFAKYRPPETTASGTVARVRDLMDRIDSTPLERAPGPAAEPQPAAVEGSP